MERITVVITGRVGSEIALHVDPDGNAPFARFRMVSPRGRWKDDGIWEEQEGGWYTVKAWGNLAINVHHSLRKGNPVVVVGRPAAQAWINKENAISSEIAIHASAIGHDLSRGVSSFSKTAWETEKPSGQVVRDDNSAATSGSPGEAEGAGTAVPAPATLDDEEYQTEQVSLAAAK